MIDWSILNIQETTDEETITFAYRKMLTVTNPEDNQEGFMLLRNTYEQALQYARNANTLSSTVPMQNTNETDSAFSQEISFALPGQENFSMKVTDVLSEDSIYNQNNNMVQEDDYAVEGQDMNTERTSGIYEPSSKSSLEKTQYIDNIKELLKKNNTGDFQETKKIDIPRINEELQQNTSNIKQPMDFKEELKPIELWIGSVAAVYMNFEQRVSIQVWQELLNNDVCVSLDTRMDATDAILTFLMKHYNIPQKIWILLDETFGFKANKKELMEKYPREFIENVVICSIDYQDVINYDLFNMGLMIDYDQFITMYFELVRMMRAGNMAGAYDLIIQLDTFGPVHPYIEVEKIKYYINVGQLAIAAQNAMLLYQQYPDDVSIIYIKAEISNAYGNIAEAKTYYEKLLSINSNHYYARIGLANCYVKEMDYEKAKDTYTILKSINPYDEYVTQCLDDVNEKLITVFENATRQNETDIRIRTKLAWCYLQKNDVDNAMRIALEIEKLGDIYESSNILGRCYLYIKDSKRAILNLEKWVDCIRNIPRNGNIENKAKYSRLGQAFELLGQAYEMEGQEKKALNLYKLAVKEEPSDIGHKLNLARYQLELRRFESCIETCTEVIDKEPRNFNALYYRAVAYFKTDHLAKSLEGLDECLDIYQYDISTYVYKIRILIKYCEYEKVNEIFDYLDRLGLGSDALTFYKTKMRYEKEIIEESKTNDEDEFDYSYYLDTYENLLLRYKEGKSDIDDPMPLYIEMANLYINIKDYKQSLTVLKNVHEKDKNNVEVYECLAISFENLGELRAATESYKRILVLCPDHREANVRLAGLYERQFEYKDALKYYTKQLDLAKSIQGLLNRGAVYLKLDDFKMARKDFKEAVKMNPYNPISYNYLGITYLYEDNYKEAMSAFEKAVERIEQELTPLPYRNLAITYIKLGDIDKAIECYEKNIEQFNELYDYEQIAILMYEQKNYKKSVEVYTKMSKLRDDASSKIDLYVWVGKCNTGLQSENTALKYYTKALQESKIEGIESYHVCIQVAKMYMELGKYDMSMKFFKKIRKKEAMSLENKLDFAFCCMSAKNFSEAQNIIKSTIEEINKISDNDITQLAKKNYLLGYAYFVQGNYVKANEHIEKIANSRKCEGCKYNKCHKAMALEALILDKTGEREKAIDKMEEALKITPGISRYIHEYNRICDKYKHI